MSSDLARIPKVTTLAKPSGQVLLAARFEVQRNQAVRAIFEKYQGQKGEEAANALAAELREPLEQAINGDVADACQYLADEYLQIGDSVLIVDRVTGLPLMKVTDEDMWQPPDVPRDSGNMATPLMQLKPELLGFLMRWTFESARERDLVTELATRVAQTPMLVEQGDRRLLPTTREGRKVIMQDLQDALPDLLPQAATGTLRHFLEGFEFSEPKGQSATLVHYPGFKAYARVIMPLTDHKARNLLFDVLSSHRAVITSQWGREIARTFSRLAHTAVPPTEVSFPKYCQDFRLDRKSAPMMWVAPPAEALLIKDKLESFAVAVEGALTTGARWWPTQLGHIVLKEPNIAQREVHDRWEIAATIDYDLYVDWSQVKTFQFTEVPVTVVAEFVR